MSSANTSNDTKSLLIAAVKTALDNKAQALAATVNGNHVEVSINKLPTTLRLAPCQQEPTVSIITGFEAGPQRIKVTCQKPKNWSIYIKGYIRIYAPVLVSRHNLPRGRAIKASDIVFAEKEISLLRRGYIYTMDQVIRTETKKPLIAGKVLTPAMLRPAVLIHRGDRITLIVKEKNIAVSMPGKALESGALNEQIRVKNISSGKILQGRILGQSAVSIW